MKLKFVWEVNAILNINTLGKFQMISKKQTLSAEDMRSDMLLKILIYILIHRQQAISVQELSEALWQEDETSNPTGALKNLVYRVRKYLKEAFGDRDYILTTHGGYSWNPDVEVVLDIELLEEYITKAKNVEDLDSKIKFLSKAIDLYKGDFGYKILDKYWAITVSTYYHSLFLNAVKNLVEIYFEKELYEKAEEIASIGLRYDDVDEILYCYKIKALMKGNKIKEALEQYDYAETILRDALGISKPANLVEIYQELLKQSNKEIATGIDDISKDMIEEENPNGAFICGYPVFKEIYRLEARKISRMGEAEYILLLTIDLKEGIKTSKQQMTDYLIQKAVERMEQALIKVLRIGDVAARYSERQFVVLLPTCTYESSMRVSERILSFFFSQMKGDNISVKIEYEEVNFAKTVFVK